VTAQKYKRSKRLLCTIHTNKLENLEVTEFPGTCTPPKKLSHGEIEHLNRLINEEWAWL
jgi:hypothetical protein